MDELVLLHRATVDKAGGDTGAIGEKRIDLSVLRAPSLALARAHLGENLKGVFPTEIVFGHATGIDQLFPHVVHDLFDAGQLRIIITDVHFIANDAVGFDE